jgi:hypothetical protein
MAMGLLMEALACSLSQAKPTLACSVMCRHSRGRQPNADASPNLYGVGHGLLSAGMLQRRRRW